MSTQLALDKPGTLIRPGIIGRTTRFLFAAACFYAFWSVLDHGDAFLVSTPTALTKAVAAMAVAFWLFPYVVNIGFSKGWGRWPQVAIILLLLAAAAGSWVSYGGIFGPPVGLVMFVWLVYVFGHLGVSFALSSVLATPGCEMRAIPHLLSLVTGQEAKEHYCPVGPLHRIDKWEASLK